MTELGGGEVGVYWGEFGSQAGGDGFMGLLPRQRV